MRPKQLRGGNTPGLKMNQVLLPDLANSPVDTTRPNSRIAEPIGYEGQKN